MLALAQRIIDYTGSKSTLVFKPLPADDPKQRQPDITKARDILGWQPTVEVEQGLRATIDYFEALLSRFAATSSPSP